MNAALEGVKVLDFSWALVGSVTTKALGDFGATVIKVESSRRPCLTRTDVQVAASSANSFDNKPWFAHLNSSKLGLQLDLTHPRAMEVLAPLIAWADIVVENFSPGTMAKLGLDYSALRRRKRDIILVSGSVFGQDGPLSREWGVDGTGAALGGRLALTGDADRAPVTPGAIPYGDVVMPYFMAATAAAALQKRRETGEGCHIDASMYEVCVQQMAPALQAHQLGAPLARRGNREAGKVQGVYPCRGEDRWVAISIRNADEWTRLTRIVGGAWPSWRDALALDDAALDTLDRRIAAWTSVRADRETMRLLQDAAIPAGVVQDCEDLVEHDAQLRHRGALALLDHAELGAFEHMATPIQLSRTPQRLRPAPAMGGHTDYICTHYAGLDAARVAQLRAEGLFT